MRPTSFLPLLLAIHAPLAGQVLVGQVVDEATAAPITGADVHLLDAGGTQLQGMVTDSTGRFQFSALAPGSYSLRVIHLAYTAYTTDPIDVQSNQTLDLEIRLGREAIPLDPLVVKATSSDLGRLAAFHERAATNAFGSFIKREQMENRPAAQVTDFLRSIGSVRVVAVKRDDNPDAMTTNLVMMRGRGNEGHVLGTDDDTRGYCMPAVFLDGIRVEQSANFPIDHLTRPHMLEGIEVYTSLAQVPNELQTSVTCGVVAMWSRQGSGGGTPSWKRNAIGLATLGLILFLIR